MSSVRLRQRMANRLRQRSTQRTLEMAALGHSLTPEQATAIRKCLARRQAYPQLIRGLGCIVDRSCEIVGETILGKHVSVGPRTLLMRSTIGDYSYLGPDCRSIQATIGKFCSIASEVHVGLGSHPLAPFVSTHPALYLRRESLGWDFADRDYRAEFGAVKIGNDVWIGVRAILRDGVTIGDGAVIGAGAVVVSDVPPYAIVGGVPAKIIRYRFPPETVAFLLAFKWWDRGEDWLRQNWRTLHDIDQFVKEFRR